jgi:hypothetical protein
MAPIELLKVWERTYFTLSWQQRNAFLAHPSTRAICAYPREVVIASVGRNQKLDQVLLDAEKSTIERDALAAATHAAEQAAMQQTREENAREAADIAAQKLEAERVRIEENRNRERCMAALTLSLYPSELVDQFAALETDSQRLDAVRNAYHPRAGFADWDSAVRVKEGREARYLEKHGHACRYDGCNAERTFASDVCGSSSCPRHERDAVTWSDPELASYNLWRDK